MCTNLANYGAPPDTAPLGIILRDTSVRCPQSLVDTKQITTEYQNGLDNSAQVRDTNIKKTEP